MHPYSILTMTDRSNQTLFCIPAQTCTLQISNRVINISPFIAIWLAQLQSVWLDGKAYPTDPSILKQKA